MGWREAAATAAFYAIWDNHGDLSVHPDSLVTALCEMPPADRIALARELLEGTGHTALSDDELFKLVQSGWNNGAEATRAAMLGDEG